MCGRHRLGIAFQHHLLGSSPAGFGSGFPKATPALSVGVTEVPRALSVRHVGAGLKGEPNSPVVAAGFVAVVPMRARSRGLPGKNIRSLAGLPLYAHSVRTALNAGATAVVLSTDIESVLAQAHPSGVLAVERPAALAGDSTTMAEVLIHVLGPEQGLSIDGETTIVLLQPTSPLRAVSDIHAALDRLAQPDVELAMSVVEVDKGILKSGRLKGGRFVPLSDPAHCFSNRQSLPPVYRPNGAVYAFKAGWFRDNSGFETEHIGAVIMPPERSLDVDSIDDFERAVTLTAQLSEGAA